MNNAWSHLIQIALLAPLSTAALARADSSRPLLSGRWDAVVVSNEVEVPFPFEIELIDGAPRGSFFNGEHRTVSTAGRVAGSTLTLAFDQYATKLVAELKDGELVGEYQRPRGVLPFRAVRARPKEPPAATAPSIDGAWVVRAKSTKGEAAWRFIARQKGSEVSASILRVDGDTGTLSGSYIDGRFVLSHFSGARPLRLEVTPKEDGTLTLKLNGKTELEAAREHTEQAAAIGSPTDPELHTRVKDPTELFRFAFPDIAGRLVSNTDARFQGKVVLVNISGSWCPNCHDEAPFLAALDREYRSRGLEVVTLSFEEAEQLKEPTRLRAFIDAYDIEYTVLLAGEPDQLKEKVPQAENLDAFPTTFLLGRDGRVRRVHAGFPSPGSGAFYLGTKDRLTRAVEDLLAESR